MGSFTTRFCDAIVAKGLVKREQLTQALEEGGGTNFARTLVNKGLMTEDKVVNVLSEELNIPTISLAKYRIDIQVAQLIPERVARQYNIIPISKLGKRLVVAMADPLNIVALDDIHALTQHATDLVLAPESEIRRAIEQVYNSQADLSMVLSGEAGEDVPETASVDAGSSLEGAVKLLLSDQNSDVPVVKVINMMIVEALRKRASDIHLEPLEKWLRVRYRIDGHLVEAHQLPKAVQNTVLTRLKIMSGLDITEWRLPQDGRFKVRLDAQEVDFRVSLLPVTHGGKVVMRVLDKANLSIGLDHLGFLPASITLFKDAVKRPYSMILVTGPTGSGKSTTLYSILSELNTVTRNIITVEDPVEYQVEGITQIQAYPEIGLTFAAGLRALLRQNPDIVMIGEIRDFETADIAMKASLTGQLVLSTLHTNDAPSAVTRLVDMGVEPFLVASSVTLIEAQRLVRKLCAKCREPYEPTAQVLGGLGWTKEAASAMLAATQNGTGETPSVFYRAVGCSHCNRSGYRGRVGIIEVLLVDDRIREMVVTKAQSWEIKDYAVSALGMAPLRQDGLKKAAMGITTLEEVLRVTLEE